MNISIIIVNYRGKGLTLNCLKSIKEADWAGLSYEIIVVDNSINEHLGDILAWQYKEVKFIQNKTNLGMGAGNNLGISRAQGEYVVIMNHDTIAMRDTFRKLYDYMEANPKVGVVGPKQFNPDKTVQSSCFRWHGLLTPIWRRTFLGVRFGARDMQRFMMSDFDKNSIREVDWLLGSFLFIRGSALKQVGGFDERFFLYFEDTDLCRRFHQKNWQVVFNPEAEIIHNHGRASARTPWYKFFTNYTTRAHVMSWIKYLIKWRFK
jgi:hypothetical protein